MPASEESKVSEPLSQQMIDPQSIAVAHQANGCKIATFQRWLTWLTPAVAIAWGLWLPEFYDWTGSDQSRSPPIVGRIALGLLAFSAVAGGTLVVWHRVTATPAARPGLRFQIWQLLLLTFFTVMLLAIGKQWSAVTAYAAALMLVVAYAVWIFLRWPEYRLPVLLLLVCQWSPFLWLVRDKQVWGALDQILPMITVLPALLPTAWIGQWLRINLHESMPAGMVGTAIELWIGLWLVRRGARPAVTQGESCQDRAEDKNTIPQSTLRRVIRRWSPAVMHPYAVAYQLIVATLSLFNSFGFHALMRA